MHKKFLLLVLTISLTNCVVKKKTTYAKAKTVTIEADQPLETSPRIRKKKTKELEKADEIINIALHLDELKDLQSKIKAEKISGGKVGDLEDQLKAKRTQIITLRELWLKVESEYKIRGEVSLKTKKDTIEVVSI